MTKFMRRKKNIQKGELSPDIVVVTLQQTEINKITKTQLQNVYSTYHESGECPVQVIPQFVLLMTDYNINASILLSQLLYWTEKGNNRSGWIYKTKDEWFAETGLKRRKLESAISYLGENGKQWIEVKNLPARGGRFTGHFKITQKFIDDFISFCNSVQNVQRSCAKCAVYSVQNVQGIVCETCNVDVQNVHLNNIGYAEDYFKGDSQRLTIKEEPLVSTFALSPSEISPEKEEQKADFLNSLPLQDESVLKEKTKEEQETPQEKTQVLEVQTVQDEQTEQQEHQSISGDKQRELFIQDCYGKICYWLGEKVDEGKIYESELQDVANMYIDIMIGKEDEDKTIYMAYDWLKTQKEIILKDFVCESARIRKGETK